MFKNNLSSAQTATSKKFVDIYFLKFKTINILFTSVLSKQFHVFYKMFILWYLHNMHRSTIFFPLCSRLLVSLRDRLVTGSLTGDTDCWADLRLAIAPGSHSLTWLHPLIPLHLPWPSLTMNKERLKSVCLWLLWKGVNITKWHAFFLLLFFICCDHCVCLCVEVWVPWARFDMRLLSRSWHLSFEGTSSQTACSTISLPTPLLSNPQFV